MSFNNAILYSTFERKEGVMATPPDASHDLLRKILEEVWRVFRPGSYVKDVVLMFAIDSKLDDNLCNALARRVQKAMDVYEYQRRVQVFIPLPDPKGQLRVAVYIHNNSNASGQEHAPK